MFCFQAKISKEGDGLSKCTQKLLFKCWKSFKSPCHLFIYSSYLVEAENVALF